MDEHPRLNASDGNVDFNIAALSAPGVFPHAVATVELRETPISRIVLTGQFAYKIKKPVRLDFLDSSTLERRRELCEEELRLNRRLAPDLYCDVVGIVRDDHGRMRFGAAGHVIEYAVRMRQFAAAQEMHALLEQEAVDVSELRVLAERLSAFHRSAAVAAADSPFGGYEQVRAAMLDNLTTLLQHIPADEDVPQLDRLYQWTCEKLHELESVLEARKTGGAVRECHGDLHSRNIVRWHGVLTPFDCLEFDPKLRWIDVMNDIAFLVMDLASQQRGDLAFAFCSGYLECSGDYDGVPLLVLFAVYRALVRAKVDALAIDAKSAREFHERLHMRIRAAVAWLDRPTPILIIMHGVSGSGKSWLSERLAPRLRAVRVRSDVERKRLAGAQKAAPATYGNGIYTAAFTHRTYARLLDCAESCLQGGISVIVDGAFLEEIERRMFHDLALRRGARYFIVSCVADEQLAQQRIEARRRAVNEVSDADPAILRRQLETLQPLQPYEQEHLVPVDTAAADALNLALTAFGYRLAHSDAFVHSKSE